MAPRIHYQYKLSLDIRDFGVMTELTDQIGALFIHDVDSHDHNVFTSPLVPSDTYERVNGTVVGLGLQMSWRTQDLEPKGDVAVKRIHVEIYTPDL